MTDFICRVNKLYANDPEKLKLSAHILARKARDHARTPMQWTSALHGGFTSESATPWMRVNDDYKTVNAEAQTQKRSLESVSVHQFWKQSLAFRKAHKGSLVYGGFELLDDGSKQTMAYRRFNDTEQFLTVLNFSGEEAEYQIPENIKVIKWVVGNYTTGAPDKSTSGTLKLGPWEGVLGECSV